MSRWAVLWSQASWQSRVSRALKENAVYAGVHLGQPYRWLKGHHAYLGVNGARHFLWRQGIPHLLADEEWLQSSGAQEVDAILIPEAEALDSRSIEQLERLAALEEIWLVIAGPTNLPDALLGVSDRSVHFPKGHLWSRDDIPLIHGLPASYPIAAPHYPLHLGRPLETTQAWGRLGERAAHPAASIRAIPAPVLFRRGRLIWIPSSVFEYLGGLIQAHADWWPLHQALGADAPFYADRLCQRVAGWLRQNGAGHLLDLQVFPWGRHSNAVVLRHDTDDSLDPAFFEIEVRDRIRATYSVLNDKRGRDWIRRLNSAPHMELALHYRTNREGVWDHLMLRLLHQTLPPDRQACTQDGLLRQVREAGPAFEALRTIHRHYQYVYYPELLLALEHLVKSEGTILGSSSMSRFHLFRYGGSESVLIRHPHVGVPFHFPIQPVIATAERHVALPLWENAALMEPDPHQIRACVRFAEQFPGGCYTWIFHPAHASGDSFARGGTLNWFRTAQQEVGRSWQVATIASIYERMKAWSRLTLRKIPPGLEIYNPTSEPIEDVVVRQGSFHHRFDRIEADSASPLPLMKAAAVR